MSSLANNNSVYVCVYIYCRQRKEVLSSQYNIRVQTYAIWTKLCIKINCMNSIHMFVYNSLSTVSTFDKALAKPVTSVSLLLFTCPSSIKYIL